MKKSLLSLLISLAGALSAHAGSCQNFIKVTEIGNVEVEVDGNILLNPKVMAYGTSWSGITLDANGHLIARSTSSPEFRNHVLATLYSAQAIGQPVYLQVYVESAGWFRIDKVSTGNNPLGLDCRYYQSEISR